MKITLDIENHYPDTGSVIPTFVLDADVPDYDPTDEEWAWDHIMPFTGTGRTEGDSCYFVKVVTCDDPRLVGKEFEFGT